MSATLKLQATAILTLTCNQCKRTTQIVTTKEDTAVYGVINDVRRDARIQSTERGWLWRSYGNKGIKHFCPTCAQTPELAAWKMNKILTGKWKKTAFVD